MFNSVEGRAALALAEAEAHLERTQHAERSHREKMVDIALKSGRRSVQDIVDLPMKAWFEYEDMLDAMIENYSDPEIGGSDRDYLVGALKIIRRRNPNRPAKLSRQMRKFSGYRRRAEVRRNRAFTAWLHAHEA